MTAQELVDKFNAQYPVEGRIVKEFDVGYTIMSPAKMRKNQPCALLRRDGSSRVSWCRIDELLDIYDIILPTPQPTATEMFERLSEENLQQLYDDMHYYHFTYGGTYMRDGSNSVLQVILQRIEELKQTQ